MNKYSTICLFNGLITS